MTDNFSTSLYFNSSYFFLFSFLSLIFNVFFELFISCFPYFFLILLHYIFLPFFVTRFQFPWYFFVVLFFSLSFFILSLHFLPSRPSPHLFPFPCTSPLFSDIVSSHQAAVALKMRLTSFFAVYPATLHAWRILRYTRNILPPILSQLNARIQNIWQRIYRASIIAGCYSWHFSACCKKFKGQAWKICWQGRWSFL